MFKHNLFSIKSWNAAPFIQILTSSKFQKHNTSFILKSLENVNNCMIGAVLLSDTWPPHWYIITFWVTDQVGFTNHSWTTINVKHAMPSVSSKVPFRNTQWQIHAGIRVAWNPGSEGSYETFPLTKMGSTVWLGCSSRELHWTMWEGQDWFIIMFLFWNCYSLVVNDHCFDCGCDSYDSTRPERRYWW